MNETPKSGQTVELYRAVFKEYEKDPIPSRSDSGRFHNEAMTTTYLAAAPETAWKEVTFRWNADRKNYRMATVRVKLNAIVDLTDPDTQEHYGVDEEVLTEDDYMACQRLSRLLRADGFEGIWTYSKADKPNGTQLVVLLDRMHKGSSVRAIKTGAVNV